ncbi:YhdH/YhfP family quinone oxidoreductase [Fusibacter bizertensis]
MQFKALRVYLEPTPRTAIEMVDETILPDHEVLIEVHYSSLNYKDALSASGNKGVSKNYPHTPGIDVAGIVKESKSDLWHPGDQVIVTGYDLGMNTYGGFSQYVKLPADWIVACPNNMSLREAMCYGTAGFTAALSVEKIVTHLKPDSGEILVTGATGGVGTVAVAILSKLGYDVAAATGKATSAAFLQSIGAKTIVSREEIDDQSGKALLRPRWAGVIDTVGGNILTTAIKSTQYLGHITCCGNVSSPEFTSSIYPFILKGVTLHGIDSVACPKEHRFKIWENLSSDWAISGLYQAVQEISLDQVPEQLELMLKGKHQGRTIVSLKDADN